MEDVREIGGGSRDPSDGLRLDDPFLSQRIPMRARARQFILCLGFPSLKCGLQATLLLHCVSFSFWFLRPVFLFGVYRSKLML